MLSFVKSAIFLVAGVGSTAAYAGPRCHVDHYRVTNHTGETKAWVTSGGRCTGRFQSGGIATLAVGKAPAHGTLTTDGNDTWNYVPVQGYKGPDPFTILINEPKTTAQLTVDMDVR